MKTTIVKKKPTIPANPTQIKKLTSWLGGKLTALTAPQAWDEVTVILVDDEGITETNREFFNKNRPTDVISFRYDPIPGEEDLFSGDLIINVERAMQVGSEHGGIDKELALYIAHGFDHLRGADDNTPEERKRMRATELNWLRQAEKEGLIKNLTTT